MKKLYCEDSDGRRTLEIIKEVTGNLNSMESQQRHPREKNKVNYN
jgi:hypothetical protein